MRIISKYRDYYDGALGHGPDPRLMYRRATREGARPAFDLPEAFGFRQVTALAADPRMDLGLWYLAFCGTPHPLVVLTRGEGGTAVVKRCCWSVDDIGEGLRDFPEAREIFDGSRRSRFGRPFTRARATALLSEVPSIESIEALHRSESSPVILVRTTKLEYPWSKQPVTVVDPVLKDLEFFRVVDTFSAFQQISMYLGGVLGVPEETHRPIPDDAMRDMKGFDESSFKTASPGERKRRRRKKE